MPDVVPYLHEDGNKKYMPSRDYIKKELEKELTVRDDIAATLSDHSKDGLIPQFVKTVNEMHESKDIRHKARSVDKHTQNEYNDSKIFTQTNEFLREVPSESRGDFSRSLANQTSNLLDGEAKLISINAAGKVYYFLAEGYMNGRIISTSTTNIHKLKERDGYANGIKSDRKNPHRWIERVSNLGGESKSDLYLLEERGRAIRDDQIFDDASRSNRTGGRN